MVINPIQAVVFTHCARLRYDDPNKAHPDPHYYDTHQQTFIKEYAESFQRYLECNKAIVLIRDVYAYIDQGIKELIPQVRRTFTLDPDILRKERILKDVLRIAERTARQASGMINNELPQFHFVGLEELVDLLAHLWEVDPKLMRSLCGRSGTFTYDSPKFVEAIIRLAMADIPHLAKDPVIRIDDDAEVNPEAISKLLEVFQKITQESPFYFFSGQYGRRDHVYDPINDYAVRTHWFFPEGTIPGDRRFATDMRWQGCIDTAETFLSDLKVLGARQPISKDHKYSVKLQELVSQGRLPTKPRAYPQVISGAGLIMSRRSITLLPPFMNFSNLITWVDDHLKRELHERLGDIGETEIQCVPEATFQQERHKCLTQKDIDDTEKGDYFKRLLDGCVLSAIIMDDTQPPTYCGIIRDIVTYRMRESQFSQSMRNTLQDKMVRVGSERYELVLQCWTSDEFRPCTIYRWADNELRSYYQSRTTAPAYIPDLVRVAVADAMEYLGLLFNWHKFTRAIERSKFVGNAWLYF